VFLAGRKMKKFLFNTNKTKTMGIKSLSKFLKEHYPQVFETIHISEYQFKKVAIDTSLYLCNYKASVGEGWLNAFLRLVSLLRENEIHCFFSYDSGSPPEKQAEKQHRRDARDKNEDRILNLEQAIEEYENTGVVDPILLEFQNKRGLVQSSIVRPMKTSLNIQGIKFAVEKLRKQLFSISEADFALTKALFDVLQVPYANAPMEAEAFCSDLCRQGKVDAVLSEDTDVLAYGAPVFLTKMNTRDGTCMRIKYEDLLSEMEMTSEMFLDFCIMCGTDYNKNIFRVGPAKAFSLIQEHKSIEEVGKNTKLDISVLNHVRVRQLFRDYPQSSVKVPYCGSPDFVELQQFVFKKNIRTSVDALRKSFCRELIFETDSPKEGTPEEGSPVEGTPKKTPEVEESE